MQDMRFVALGRASVLFATQAFLGEKQRFELLVARTAHDDVVAYGGLELTSLCVMEGQLLDAIPFADSVMRLSARCTYCSGAAPFTMRIVADEAQELVGGSESYAPVCRRHYNALSSVRGALTSGGQQQQLPQAAAACCN